MKYVFLASVLLTTVTGFSQATLKKNSAGSLNQVSMSLSALWYKTNSPKNTTTDTTYLSSADFSGSGTINDPIRVKAVVIQNWLQSLPGFVNDGSKYLASDFTWKTIQTTTSTVPLNAPVLTATATSNTTIFLSWTDVPNESSYLLQSSTDNSLWTTIAAPSSNTTQFTNNGLAPATLYYYRIKAVGDNTSYSDSPFGSDNESTPPGSTSSGDENILFNLSTAFQIQEHPDGPGTYYSSQSSGIAQATKKMAAGTDGLVYFQYFAQSGDLLSLGFTTTNGVQGYERWQGGIYLFGTQLKTWDGWGSSSGTGISLVDNHYYGFRRNGNVIEIVTSTDRTNWTVVKQTSNIPGDLYIHTYLQTNSSKIKVFGKNLVSF